MLMSSIRQGRFFCFLLSCYNSTMKKELEKLRNARSAKNAQSAKKFPNIDLQEDEHIVLSMTRTKLGLLGIWLFTAIIIILITTILIVVANNSFVVDFLNMVGSESTKYLYIIVGLAYFIIIMTAIVSHIVYYDNKMFVTNKRAIQQIRTSLFSGSMNIIDLQRIEDVSFKQNGFFDTVFNVGTLRMSTVGDETTYTFELLDTPHDEVAIISKLVTDSHRKAKDSNYNPSAKIAEDVTPEKPENSEKD